MNTTEENNERLLDYFLKLYNWEDYYASNGSGSTFCVGLKQFLLAKSKDEAFSRYTQYIDNVAFVQDGVFEIAEPAIHICLLSMATINLSNYVKIMIFDFLYWAIHGVPTSEAVSRGNQDVIKKCIEVTSPFYFLLLKESVEICSFDFCNDFSEFCKDVLILDFTFIFNQLKNHSFSSQQLEFVFSNV
ncbi:MAG: hypothetical protein U0798_14955 [Gemmataceae bacterium]